MPDRISFKENVTQPVDDVLRAELLAARVALRKDLAPRLEQLVVGENTATLQNLVGSFRLPRGDVVDVLPKVDGGRDWSEAVVQLLTADTRISITGSRRSRATPRRNDLTYAIALEYARRLEMAIRHAGPIEVYERHHLLSHRLRGHLNVSKWMRTALLDPTRFPVSVDELSGANDFSRALSVVAGQLGRSIPSGELSAQLRRLQSEVIPGQATPSHAPSAVSRRMLPAQWSTYRPAWDLAVALLRNHSIIGDAGRSIGLEVAIEPWPLLETLLTRALHGVARDTGMDVAPKTNHPLLRRMDGAIATRVVPDGALQFEGRTVATFECKYTVPGATPRDSHAHQALATAAALGAPVAVLVYPNDEPALSYRVEGFQGRPANLITVGLSMYSYRRTSGDEDRAALLRQVLNISAKDRDLDTHP
jgi:hypothetical protein